ncbi:toxin [Microbacterium invictum]|uniref:Adenylate kinase family enzyme n=1 Tax=Microbacterium invictum TaxID=515415 RepID=A0AA40SL52_9MICO|nr:MULTISPECIES: toxin [Microbacterium]MBB4138238.1 adenylate kinase family enzyme [Microbacterium invictum]
MPPAGPAPRRLRIVGTSGSGKTSLGRQVAGILGVPHLELDAVFWDAGWTRRDPDDARAIVRRFAEDNPDGWVADGNWTSLLDGLLDPGTPGGADAMVWVDHPRRVVMWRVITRTVRRGIHREELWHGNRERISTWLRWNPEENIIRWAWTSYARVQQRMRDRIDAGDRIIHLRGQREVDAWLASLAENRRTVER